MHHPVWPFRSAMGRRTLSCSCFRGLGITGPVAESCLTWAIVAQWYAEFWCTVRRCCSSRLGPTVQPTCGQERRRKVVSLWVPTWAPLYLPALASLYFPDRAIIKQLGYFQTLRLKAECAAAVSPVLCYGNWTHTLKQRDGDGDTMRCRMGEFTFHPVALKVFPALPIITVRSHIPCKLAGNETREKRQWQSSACSLLGCINDMVGALCPP